MVKFSHFWNNTTLFPVCYSTKAGPYIQGGIVGLKPHGSSSDLPRTARRGVAASRNKGPAPETGWVFPSGTVSSVLSIALTPENPISK